MTSAAPSRDELLVRLADLLDVFEPAPSSHCDVPGCVHCAAEMSVAA